MGDGLSDKERNCEMISLQKKNESSAEESGSCRICGRAAKLCSKHGE